MKSKLKRILSVPAKALLLLIVLALAGLPAVFMNTAYGYLPLLLLAVLLLLSVLCLFVLGRGLSARASGADVQCRRGKSVEIALQLVNRSRLFCPKATAYIYISDLFGIRGAMRALPFAIAGKGTVDFGFEMEMPHVGCFSVGLDHVEIYDFFGVFRKRVPVSGRFSAVITPRVRTMDGVHIADDVLTEASKETKISVVGGTDYTGVRAYALGDPMKQIHWKLSAHTREYVTKIQESNRQQEFAVILDFVTGAAGRERLMDLNDCLIETALSLIAEIAAHDAGYALLYADKSGTPVRTVPLGRDDDAALVRSFALIGPEHDETFPDACQLLQQESQGQNRSSNVAVVTSRVTAELIQELLRVKQQRRSPELYFVIPAEWGSRERENACAPLRQLDDAEVPYFVVSTEENFKEQSLKESNP